MIIAGYGRVSTSAQVKDGTSLEDQKKIVLDKCDKEGHELFKFYSDEGVSGGTLQRPALQRLIADAKEKRFEAVYFTKLDRLGRSVRDIANLYHELHAECGIGLVCIDDPSLNTSGKMGDVMRGMLSTFAQFERAMIRERTLAGRAAKWEKGEVVIGELTFGYRKNGTTRKVEIVEEYATIYRKIVDLYLDQRLSMKQIALELTREAIPSPSSLKGRTIKSSRWNSITIGDILKNPAYKGEAIFNKELYEARKNGKKNRTGEDKPPEEWVRIQYPPLITADRWQQIQDRIKTQRHKPKRVYKDYEAHFMLDGFIYCGECGSRMKKRVKANRDGSIRLYYTCYWRGCGKKELESMGRTGCILESVNADQVDQELYDQVVDMLCDPDKYVERWLEDLNADELKEKIANLENKSEKLLRQLKNGFEYITTIHEPNLKKIYVDELKKWQQEWDETNLALVKTRSEFESSSDKLDRYREFKEIIARTPIGSRLGKKLTTKAAFKSHMFALPFSEKKRITEAIISPENGGRCEILYPRPEDVADHDDLSIILQDDDLPLTDRKPMVTGNFKIDLDKIAGIIGGLNRRNLLTKEHPGSFPRRSDHAY